MNGPQSLILQAIEFTGAGSYYSGGSNAPASIRSSFGGPTGSNDGVSFRSALYVSL